MQELIERHLGRVGWRWEVEVGVAPVKCDGHGSVLQK